MKDLLDWFFSTPTAFVAVLSLIVAFFAYKYQRNWDRKQHTKNVTEWYAKVAIPKMRYINNVLTSIGCTEIIQKFSKFEDFDTKELEENLLAASIQDSDFKKCFDKITKDVLNNAFTESGCNEYICQDHKNLVEPIKKDNCLSYSSFRKFVIDFLNEIESNALQFNYCIYDEKMVYPILHQAYLKNIKFLYFFIASENTQDYDQFYIYTIWLYNLWDKRVKKEKKKLKQKFAQKSKISKV